MFWKICPVCHKAFESRGRHHIYCSAHCRKAHHKVVYYDKNRTVDWQNNDEVQSKKVIRHFVCKKCHKVVAVTDKKDRRQKFCCPHCEKLYWKHPEKYRVEELPYKSV